MQKDQAQFVDLFVSNIKHVATIEQENSTKKRSFKIV